MPARPDALPRCAVCDAPVADRYCGACGARRPAPEDESLGRFLREQFQEVTSADGKHWRTLKALFVPGKLTAEYLGGRRDLYVRPVRVFLLLNVVFFFVLSSAGGSFFRGPLESHRGAELYGPLAERLAEAQAARWGVAPDVYEAAFDQRADTLAPSLIGLLIPLYAILLALVLASVRASGLRHVVLATHAVATFIAAVLALLVGVSLLLGVLAALGLQGTGDRGVDPILLPTIVVAIVAYLGVAVRRVYGVPRLAAAAAGLVLGTVGLVGVMLAFRAALFFATVGTLDPPA